MKHGPTLDIRSPNVRVGPDAIHSKYKYQTTRVRPADNGRYIVTPSSQEIELKTLSKVARLGVMLVGWGGNNGSTVTASVLANKLGLTWGTKHGMQSANYIGSLTQASTLYLGQGPEGGDVHVPFHQALPMVDPDSIIFDGWDISSMNMAGSMKRAEVLDWGLQEQLRPHMEGMMPRPSVHYPSFIAENQDDRADNLIPGTKQEQMEHIQKDIREFKLKNGLDQVIVLWTANTERFSEVIDGVHDTAANLLSAINAGHEEISPSVVFATASILEGCCYINGSPQNTMVPGVLELAEKRGVHVAGDDFKSGQTKIKSVMVDFLISAGIKPTSIVSYNHLGNNDGKNLSAPQQFRSKEISKSNVVDDMVASNRLLYAPGEAPDHTVVIKYVPSVGDSKRAMDEYSAEIMMGGTCTVVTHAVCEDSLLAAPIILDLVILAELCHRISIRRVDDGSVCDTASRVDHTAQSKTTTENGHVGVARNDERGVQQENGHAGRSRTNKVIRNTHPTNGSNNHDRVNGIDDGGAFLPFHSVLSILSYLCKAPLVPAGTPVVNALFRQRACIENIFRACLGLAPTNHMGLQLNSSIPPVTKASK